MWVFWIVLSFLSPLDPSLFLVPSLISMSTHVMCLVIVGSQWILIDWVTLSVASWSWISRADIFVFWLYCNDWRTYWLWSWRVDVVYFTDQKWVWKVLPGATKVRAIEDPSEILLTLGEGKGRAGLCVCMCYERREERVCMRNVIWITSKLWDLVDKALAGG